MTKFESLNASEDTGTGNRHLELTVDGGKLIEAEGENYELCVFDLLKKFEIYVMSSNRR